MPSNKKTLYGPLAALTAATMGGAVILFSGALGRQRGYEIEAQERADDYARRSNSRISNLCITGTRTRLGECVHNARDFARREQRAEYDLEAQRVAALWTVIMGWMSALAVILSSIGVWLIYGTFKQTQEQASEIAKSIVQAARSATAMEGVAVSMAVNAAKVAESVGFQKEFGEMQLRAHVSVLIGEGIYQDRNLRFEVRPRVLNNGNTPAHNLRWRIAADVLSLPLADDFRFPLRREVAGGTILAPQQDAFMSYLLPDRFPEEEVSAIKAGIGKAVFVWGIVSYRDVFNRLRRCTFAQQLYWVATGEMREDGHTPQGMRGMYLPRHNRTN